MTTAPAGPDERRKWYGLALRHLRMASRLLERGFADGAVFHTYHAYECVLSSMIAARGYPVPPEGWTSLVSPAGKRINLYPSPSGGISDRSAHKARVVFFGELADRTKPYFAVFASLSRFFTTDVRNDALYYDAQNDRLPHEQYDRNFCMALTPQVRLFAQEVWREVR